MAQNTQKEIFKVFILPLIQGLATAVIYGVVVHSFPELPNLFILGLVGTFFLCPLLLITILFESKKSMGVYSIKRMLGNVEKSTFKRYICVIPIVFICSAVIYMLGNPISNFFKDKLFSWLPNGFILATDLSVYSKSQLVLAFISSLLLTGIIIPIVEEIYFRGYLMPKMAWLGKWAPIVNAILFAGYHFWSPWQFIVRSIAVIPMTFAVHKTKNIRIGIILHCLFNIAGDSAAILLMLIK